MNSVLNISVSCFKDCLTPDNPRPVNLLTWLTSDKYRAKVEQIRSIQDKTERDTLKRILPAITPAGTFSHRSAEGLVSHSGLIAFDIDFKDNQQISNYSDLKDQLKKLQNVAYCALSVSGAGYWGLIPISNPDKHKEHFQALIQDFGRLGITLDKSGADVCRLRIYSFDPEGYFNHNALPYTKLYVPRPKPAPAYHTPTEGENREKVERIIAEIKLNRIDITSDYEDEWFAIAAAFANEFGPNGRGYFHEVSQFHPKYDQQETDRLFNAVLRKRYLKFSIGSFFHIADNYGIRFKAPPMEPPEKFLTVRDLKALALQHIGEFNHLPGGELARKIGTRTFNQLIDNKVITQVEPLINEYCLTNSTPF
jgi:hypothetical protein